MDSKPKWPYRQLADGYNFVDAASTGFDGAVLMIPSSLTGFNQTAFGYVRDPNGGTTMCFGGILTSCGNAPCCPECGRRMHINGTVTGEIKHVPFGSIPVSIGFQKYLYRCPECGDCISEPVEFQADGHRITKQLQQMVEDCLAYGSYGYFDPSEQLICVVPEKVEDDVVVLHEMIHLHEYVLNDLPLYYHDMVYWALYKDLRNKIPDLDCIITEHAHALNENELYRTGGLHDILFLLKSFDLDIRKGFPLGTVFGYGRVDEFKNYKYKDEQQ